MAGLVTVAISPHKSSCNGSTFWLPAVGDLELVEKDNIVHFKTEDIIPKEDQKRILKNLAWHGSIVSVAWNREPGRLPDRVRRNIKT
jgi:hypothetical protein